MLRFTKMHGLGNDFVVLDAIRQAIALTPAKIRFIADRHFGIGCDQVLIVEPPISENADFRYRIFNADGSEVAQCGNGARCFARFVREQGLTEKNEICVDTDAGRLVLSHQDDGTIRVDMGVPRHAPDTIPLRVERERMFYRVTIDGTAWEFGAVSMGNPHAVIRVHDVDQAPVATLGKILETHECFPERANIGFMQRLGNHHIRLRVFERGVGETLACGSGACAAVVVGMEQGLLQSPVRVDLRGGELMIDWAGREHSVFLRGPAVSVFEGQINL
jgi:diaminopimelate epimerase